MSIDQFSSDVSFRTNNSLLKLNESKKWLLFLRLFSSSVSNGQHRRACACVYGLCVSVRLGQREASCPRAITAPCPVQGGIHLLAWTVSLSGTARSYGALQALSTVISRFTSDFQSRARIVGWEAVIKKPLHGHFSCSSLYYVSRC